MTDADRWTVYFWLFSIAHLVLWTFLPSLAQPNAPLDVVEMAYWGGQWQLGYWKHPPLAAWAAEAAVTATRGALWGVYLASQLAVVTAFWAAWRLGRELLSPRSAFFAAALLEGCFYYNVTTPEFNNNVALYPFWALAVLAFYHALASGAWRHWAALGACLGAGLLAKYSMALLILAMLAFLLRDPTARHRLRGVGPYVGALVAVLVLAPHLHWAVQQQFPGIASALERTRSDGVAGARLINTAKFAGAQLVALAPMLLVLLPLTGIRWRLRALAPDERCTRRFLFWMVLGPFVAYLALALLLDLKLRSMYGSHLWTFTGVLLLFSLAQGDHASAWRRSAVACAAVVVVMAVVTVVHDVGWPYLRGAPLRIHFPGRELAWRVERAWRARYDRPLRVVAGEWWLAGNVALYGASGAEVYGGRHPDTPELSARHNPWTSDEALKREGGIVLWSLDRHGPGALATLCDRLPSLERLEPVTLSWQTGAPIPPVHVGLALVPPRSDRDQHEARGSAPSRTMCPQAPRR